MNKRLCYGLLVVFVIGLALKLFLANGSFTLDESYFHERVISTIAQTGHAPHFDTASYGGRVHSQLFIFHYLVAPAYFLFGPKSLTLITSLFTVLCAILVGLISFGLTKKEYLGTLAAFCALFIPNLAQSTSEVTPIPFNLFLFLLCIYGFFKKKDSIFAISLIVLALSSPISVIFAIAFAIYVMISSHKKHIKRDREILVLSVALVMWLQLLIYKEAIFFHGTNLIYANLPMALRSSVFFQIDILTILVSIGVIPIILGAYAAYHHVKHAKKEDMFLLSALILLLVLVFLSLITPSVGLSLIGLLSIILFAQSILVLDQKIKHFKISQAKPIVIVIISLLFIITSIIPSVSFQSDPLLSNDEIRQLSSMKIQNATILTTIESAHAVSFLTKNSVVADSNFEYVRSPELVIKDIETVYTSFFAAQALEQLDRYGATHVLYLKKDIVNYGKGHYLDSCFDLIFNGEIQLYEVKCHT